MTSDPAPMSVDVISDVMCPWCFIGKRRLERAAEMAEGEFDLSVTWRPFQLDATIPAGGVDRREYLDAKFGGADQAQEAYARIGAAGASEGIDFNFEAIDVSPNTLDAHRVIRWAGGVDEATQGAVVEQLFRRFFLHGEDIGKTDVLARAAGEAGMDDALVRDLLATERDVEEVGAEAAHAAQIGVTGVPCFIFARRIAVSGAHEPETLIMAMREAAKETRAV
ncbi:DsbA family oxidoreductase [Roseitalea porphyridii]|uniref:DsbA family oxidoreductase n=1 Tax=Roseitalea porphyridii TaxID=1852022 RepID=A0A4P6V0B0_9HYPH|nr:DsbA family oxidoreductase [Roseitalea porphyridii]QBK30762.1 DsbA family oxidoreductase [Roseitalea porphyridii]